MKDLLFLVHRIPYPPNKGDKIRSWNILAYLAERYRVHVGGFVDDPHDWQFTGRIEEIAASTCFQALDRRAATLRSASSLFTGAPQTCAFYSNRALRDWVRRTSEENTVERIFVYSSSMAQYIPDRKAGGCRAVLDFVDIDSDKWRQYADRKPWPMSMIYRREARTLFAYEKAMAAAVDAAVFVSEDEAALFRRLAPGVGDRVHGIANGVDCEFFDPRAVGETPYDGADARRLVFTGAMDYWANVDAVQWFADEIFPAIREAAPDAEFWIVGANPVPEVEKLAGRDGIHVTGRVADVRPYIHHAELSVAPLRVARGIQNKVLEAMALEKAIVASPEAMEGIDAAADEVRVAGDAAAFAGAAIDLLQSADRPAMGGRARRRVVDNYGWVTNLQKFESILEADGPGGRLAAGTGD